VFSFRLHQEIEKTPVWPDSFDKTISGWTVWYFLIYNYHKLKLC
jgi:hypothetical protein